MLRLKSIWLMCSFVGLLSASGSLIYLESGGVVSGEAELYSGRTTDPQGRTWLVVPDESSGAGTILNPRNGKYVQSLPDLSVGGNGPLVAPEITYNINISTPGIYRLYMRIDANMSQNNGANSDSMFVDIVERKDGTTPTFGTGSNLIADWYQINPTTGANGGNFALDPWNSNAAPEVNSAGAGGTAPTWDIPSPGQYTLRFTVREDGVAVDAWVLQLASLTAPTGDGPPLSTIVPEPHTLGFFFIGILYLRWRTARARR